MKSIIMFAGLALGSAVMQQAVACDWNQLHANNAPATVVVCDNGGCRAVESATTSTCSHTAAGSTSSCRRAGRSDASYRSSALSRLSASDLTTRCSWTSLRAG